MPVEVTSCRPSAQVWLGWWDDLEFQTAAGTLLSFSRFTSLVLVRVIPPWQAMIRIGFGRPAPELGIEAVVDQWTPLAEYGVNLLRLEFESAGSRLGLVAIRESPPRVIEAACSQPRTGTRPRRRRSRADSEEATSNHLRLV
jgi:hypothetical protein